MKKFEYSLAGPVTHGSLEDEVAFINKYGQEGWELADVVFLPQGQGHNFYYFKRELP